MLGVPREEAEHSLDLDEKAQLVKQRFGALLRIGRRLLG
jgi:hypothetical protein